MSFTVCEAHANRHISGDCPFCKLDTIPLKTRRIQVLEATIRTAITRFRYGGALEAARELEKGLAGNECTHEGWSFKQHGRACHQCGAFLVDFGD